MSSGPPIKRLRQALLSFDRPSIPSQSVQPVPSDPNATFRTSGTVAHVVVFGNEPLRSLIAPFPPPPLSDAHCVKSLLTPWASGREGGREGWALEYIYIKVFCYANCGILGKDLLYTPMQNVHWIGV